MSPTHWWTCMRLIANPWNFSTKFWKISKQLQKGNLIFCGDFNIILNDDLDSSIWAEAEALYGIFMHRRYLALPPHHWEGLYVLFSGAWKLFKNRLHSYVYVCIEECNQSGYPQYHMVRPCPRYYRYGYSQNIPQNIVVQWHFPSFTPPTLKLKENLKDSSHSIRMENVHLQWSCVLIKHLLEGP